MNFKPLLVKIMRITFLQLVFIISMLGTSIAKNGKAQAILKQKVSIDKNNIQLGDVLHDLEKTYHVNFVYSDQVIDVKKRVNVFAHNKQLSELLNDLLQPFGLTSLAAEDVILIKSLKSLSKETTDTKNANADISITGKVVDDKTGEPIVGATVKIKGTATGVVTNINGIYTINVPDANAILVFSYIGFEEVEKPIGNEIIINAVLVEKPSNLNEVVVVGYGTQKRANVTGSVARANLQAFKDAPNTNIVQSLQGSVPGLNVGAVTSAGSTPSIQIRGRTTVSGSQSALIILDGIQYTGSLSSINPDDIESIDILKDASSTAVYGAQAANGVLLITSRKGKGAARINFSSSFATQTPTNTLRPMNRQEYLDYIKALDFTKSYTNPAYVQPDITVIADNGVKNANGLLPNDFDWYGEGTGNGFINDNQLSVSGGTDKISYLLSTGYTNQKGFIMNDLFKRKSIRAQIESKVNDWLTLGLQSFATFTDQDGAEPGLGGLRNLSPLLVPYNADGSLIRQPYSTTQDANPFANSNIDNFDRHNYYAATLYGQIDFPFLKGLSYRLNFGNNGRTDNVFNSNPYGAGFTGQVTKDVQQFYEYTLDNILTYNKSFGKHSITGTLLYGAQERKQQGTTANATGFTRQTLGYNNIGLGTVQTVSSGGYQESLNYQMFRLNYSFNDRYIFTGFVRRGGFSAFAANNKYAVFPSASAAWILSNEPFFHVPAIEFLKIRAGYGTVGNEVNRYQSLDQVSASGNTYIFGDGNTNTLFGQRVSTLGNPNLRWERTTEINLGVDFTLLKGRLSGSVDAYSRQTNDLLFNVNIPNITGFTTITTNVGGLSNRGIEISLTSVNITSPKVKWSTTVSFSRNLNKITELLGSGDLPNSGLFVGQPISAIFDYRTNGIYNIGETIPTGYYPGTRRVVDYNKDGAITTADRSILGYQDPAYRFSVLNTVTYKGFTLSAFVNSIQGGVNGYRSSNSPTLTLTENNIRWNNLAGIDWWSPTNTSGQYPRSQVSPTLNPGNYMNRSFVRLQDVTLSYKFAPAILKKIKVQNLSLFLSGKNLYTWTNWKGWDPETGSGLDIGGRPLLKSYSVGLNVTL